MKGSWNGKIRVASMLCAVKVGSKVVWILSLGNCSFYPFQVFFCVLDPSVYCAFVLFSENCWNLWLLAHSGKKEPLIHACFLLDDFLKTDSMCIHLWILEVWLTTLSTNQANMCVARCPPSLHLFQNLLPTFSIQLFDLALPYSCVFFSHSCELSNFTTTSFYELQTLQWRYR